MCLKVFIVNSSLAIDNFIHSDHAPVSMSFDFNIPFIAEEARVFIPRTAWHKATDRHLISYSSDLLGRLNRINLSCAALQCTDVHCKEHGQELVEIYDFIINSHLECADEHIPKSGGSQSERTNTGSSNVPGWNEFVKDLYEESLFWHAAWVHQGRPHDGDFFEARKLARSRYHLAVRRCKNDEDKLRMERMAEALAANNSRNFWLEAKKFKGSSNSFPRKVDDAQCQEDIADLFKEKYSALYNSVSYDSAEYEELQRQVAADISSYLRFSHGYLQRWLFMESARHHWQQVPFLQFLSVRRSPLNPQIIGGRLPSAAFLVKLWIKFSLVKRARISSPRTCNLLINLDFLPHSVRLI